MDTNKMTNKMTNKITNKGYQISLEHERCAEFKKELFISPFVENPQRYPIFRMSTKFLYLPKYYGLEKLGKPPEYNEQYGIEISSKLDGNLRDYQIETANKILHELKKEGSTLASLYTGWGKTFLALWLISQLKRKTLIIVHTENLLEQWKTQIKNLMNEECGLIQGPNFNIKDFNIVIGMIQSISMKTYEKDAFKEFGFTIFDECHHTPGRCFSKIFYKIGSKYNLGLSATITRTDGLTKVIKYFLGKVIVNIKLNILQPSINVIYTNIEPIKEKTMINGKLNTQSMITDLCENMQRNIQIVNIIMKYYNENERKILVLSERVSHCQQLKRLLACHTENTGLYIGGMKNSDLTLSNKARIILGTYKMASEGYNNPELDTLIFASPICKIEQAVGRILRQENKNKPLVIDIVDPFSFFINYFSKRNKYYTSKHYHIENKNNNLETDNSKQDIKLDKFSIIDLD